MDVFADFRRARASTSSVAPSSASLRSFALSHTFRVVSVRAFERRFFAPDPREGGVGVESMAGAGVVGFVGVAREGARPLRRVETMMARVDMWRATVTSSVL